MSTFFGLLVMCSCPLFSFFFFNDTATTEIYTLSLHDALPIFFHSRVHPNGTPSLYTDSRESTQKIGSASRSEEHTSELQSRLHLVCRLLLEKKKQQPLAHAAQAYRTDATSVIT